MKKALTILTSVMMMVVFAGGVWAKPVNLKFASIVTEKDPWGQSIVTFSQNAAKNTNETVTVTPYLGGKLGTGADTIKQVARGRIDIGGFQLADAIILVPELLILQTPFLFDSKEQWDYVVDNHLTEIMDRLFEKKGVKMLSTFCVGPAGFMSTKAVLMPEDAKGLKMRTNPNKIDPLIWKVLGSTPVPLPMVELPAAIQTGMVHGSPVVGIFYVAAGMNKLAQHYTDLNHYYNIGFYLMNLKKWERMSKEQQAQIKASSVPVDVFRAKIRGMNKALLHQYKDAGGPVHFLTAEQRQAWVEAAKAPIHKEVVEKMGGSSSVIWDAIAKGKAEFNKK